MLGGIAGILLGILYQLGADIYIAAKNWLVSPTFDSRFVISALLMFAGILAILYAAYLLRKQRKLATSKEPPTTVSSEKTLQVYERDQLPRFRDFVSKATRELDFVGVSLETVANNMDVIGERLEHGVKIRAIVPHPENQQLVKQIEATYGSANLAGVIQRTLDLLLRKRMELPTVEMDKLDILTYNAIFPIYGMILLDPNADDGLIEVDVYQSGVGPSTRPLFIIEKRTQPWLFETYYKSYRHILKQAT